MKISAYSKYQNGTPKVARKAFNKGALEPRYCDIRNIYRISFAFLLHSTTVFWSKCSRIFLRKIKHFCYKLAEIYHFFIIFEQNLVECMMSSLG